MNYSKIIQALKELYRRHKERIQDETDEYGSKRVKKVNNSKSEFGRYK